MANKIIKSFVAALKSEAKELGVKVSVGGALLESYIEARAAHLEGSAGQAGFEKALRAERNNIAMYAGIQVAENAPVADQRLVGMVHGLLAILFAA